MTGYLEILPSFTTNSILIFTSIVLFVWYYFKDKFSYWSKRGVPNINPLKCFFRTLNFTFGQENFMAFFNDQYRELEGHRFGGGFQVTKPTLIFRDPAIIKEALVKGFSSFHDRGPEPDEETDHLSGNLFQLTGERWRQVRQKLSPAFSSGKMKIMYEVLKECSQELSSYLQKTCEKQESTELDIKELMANYTMEVIGACALGIKCNAIQDPDCEFKQMVTGFFKFDLRRSVYVLLELVHPKLPRLFKLTAVSPEVEKFLRSICRDAIEMKAKDESSTRKDFLQILLNVQRSEVEQTHVHGDERAKENKVSENVDEGPIFTESVMAGVVSSFLAAGFDPVSATLTFCFYELAHHPEIQEKIFKEFQKVKTKAETDICYEDLKKCHYLEQVIHETLRKYPAAAVLSRNCTEPYKIPDSSVVVEKNVKIFIPAYSIHNDPKYFPEPDKFDPERFSEENIENIVPGSYLPFGDGPRFCIAMRFALMDMKKMVLTMVSNYTLHTCANTPKRIEFDKSLFSLSPNGGLRLRLQKRK